jgi:periplasmic protein TonB
MRLLESSAPRRRSRGGTLVSVAVHAAVIVGAAAATADAGLTDDEGVPEHIIHYAPPASPPPASPAPPPDGATRTSTSGPTFSMPAPPDVPPVDIPPIATGAAPIDPTAGLRETFGEGVSSSTGSGTATIPAGEPLAPHLVERVAQPLAPARPRYPETLRAAGVEGRASLRFVVDTAGRVEPGSVQVAGATHPLFGEAARAAVAGLRFRPAEAGGHRVRQLVELPFEFVLR